MNDNIPDPLATSGDPVPKSAVPANPPAADTIKVVAFTPSELPELRDGKKYFSISVVSDTYTPRRLPCTEQVFDEVANGRLDFDKRSDFLLQLVNGVVTEVTRMDKPSHMPAFTRVTDGDVPGIDTNLVVVKVASDSRVSVMSQPPRMAPGSLDVILRGVRSGLDGLKPGVRIEGGLVTEIRSQAGGNRLVLVRP